MSKDEPPVHLHLLESFDAGWDGLNLIYEIEPRNEMPEIDFGQHFIIIARGNFRASYMLNGRWHKVDYIKGDPRIYQLSIINYQSPITNYQLPTTNAPCPIPNAQCPMPNSRRLE